MKNTAIWTSLVTIIVTSRAVFAANPAVDIHKWLQTAPKEDSCSAAVKKTLPEFLASHIEYGGESAFNIGLSYANSEFWDLLRGTQFGAAWGRSTFFYRAKLKLEVKGGRLVLSRKNKDSDKVLKTFEFIEPIADVRFVCDKDVKFGSSETSGWLSVVYWTHTDFFRVDEGAGGVTKIARDMFDNVIKEPFTSQQRLPPGDIRPDRVYIRFGKNSEGHFGYQVSPPGNGWTTTYFGADLKEIFHAAGMNVDMERLYRDNKYREQVYSDFNHMEFHAAPRLPVNHEDNQIDFILLSRYRRSTPGPSTLRVALGQLAELIHSASMNECDRQPAIPRLDGYPTLLLRMAAAALRGDAGLRTEFADIYNEKQLGTTIQPAPNGFTLAPGKGCDKLAIEFAPDTFQTEKYMTIKGAGNQPAQVKPPEPVN